MPNRKYQKGRRFEWMVRDFFKAHGYWVLRSAGSKQEADLIAIKPPTPPRPYHLVLLIQCKATEKNRDMKEKAHLTALGFKLLCVPVWATKTSKGKLHLERLDGVEQFGW